MASVDLIAVEKRFGPSWRWRKLDLTVHDGEFLVLLVPPGCGKTTRCGWSPA
jgi:ABC-type sugar transport system ATPase subunit